LCTKDKIKTNKNKIEYITFVVKKLDISVNLVTRYSYDKPMTKGLVVYKK